MRAFFLIATATAALLAACTSVREAPSCSGPTMVLNEGLWQPTDRDLRP